MIFNVVAFYPSIFSVHDFSPFSLINHYLGDEFRIRRLTPRECFRLQGWTDDYFEKAQSINSDSQLYKQAGNGVTVNVIQAIAEKLVN
nr:DNA cytosine methyltransferase [[Clostridium] scindens]